MVKSHWARAVDLITNESWSLVDQVDPVAETILEVNLVPLGHGNTVSDNNQ